MARPIILIKPELLEELYRKNQDGVPVLALIRNHSLDITAPTLTRLLEFFHLANSSPKDAARIIRNSIFPAWLLTQPDLVKTQDPSTIRYKGKMPLGTWEPTQSQS